MRKELRICAALVIVGVVTTVGLGLVQSRSRSESRHSESGHDESSAYVEHWEYLVVGGGDVNLSPSGSSSLRKQEAGFGIEAYPVEQNLDKLGREGWELVAVTMSPRVPVYYLKRRK
ncbi:MAG: hypothetical protein ACREDR_29085 [Blastocatellia bacterium]